MDSWLDINPDEYESRAAYLQAIRQAQANDEDKRRVAAEHAAKCGELQPVAAAELAA